MGNSEEKDGSLRRLFTFRDRIHPKRKLSQTEMAGTKDTSSKKVHHRAYHCGGSPGSVESHLAPTAAGSEKNEAERLLSMTACGYCNPKHRSFRITVEPGK